MRKSVILLIGIIFIISIIIVNFFGLKITNSYEKIFIEKIEIDEIDGIYQKEEFDKTINETIFVKYLDVSLSETKYFQLKWTIRPSVVTDNKVIFTDTDGNDCLSIDQNGLITFHKKGVETVYVSSNDGQNKFDKLTIIVKE